MSCSKLAHHTTLLHEPSFSNPLSHTHHLQHFHQFQFIMAEEPPQNHDEVVVVVPTPEPDEEKKKPVTLGTHLSNSKLPESSETETTKVSDLPDTQNKALQELKNLIQEALNNHHFSDSRKPQQPLPPVKKTENKEEEKKDEGGEDLKETAVVAVPTIDDDGAKTLEAIEETVVAVSTTENSQPPAHKEEVSIWGVPLLADERSDVILLKFLRARDFKVKDAFSMMKNTIRWRKDFGIDDLMEENLGCHELDKVVFMHGFDKEGHPVCYNIFGEFEDKELYKNTFSDEEKRQRFLRWRIQLLEKSIRNLDFKPASISTIVQVNDLNNSPGLAKWELRQATKEALHLLQDNYPEFAAKQVFINVPWWYLAVNRMISPFLTQRTKSKFVFAGPSKSAETLLRYISAEQLPVKYGGLSKEGEFGNSDAVTEITVKPATKHTVEFPVTEKCLLSWELRVIGWEVSYGAEFVPSSEGSYTVIIQKARKVASSEEPVFCNSFKIGEAGKVFLTIDNPTSKKKKLLYRFKAKTDPSD
ncbi:hypothetical protein PIB30_006160 [Stylosanthes scabra]|uniref:Patellin-3 n=1 Tax=Stylosanthes scabra TaxID=79078 RepID=A0ABU6X1J6_9FABA|nr:hypothetical protein [Stylosanthes scabra]